MKRIKRLLVFILCAFTVLCTVGFLNVNAATVAEKVANASALTDGQYVIAAEKEGNNYYLPNTKKSSKPEAKSITIANGSISSVPTDAIWNFTKNSEGLWSITTTSNTLCTTGDKTGSIAVEDSKSLGVAVGVWTIKDSGSYISLTTTSSKTREVALYNIDFRFYGSSDGSHTINLYKCSSDQGSLTVNFESRGGSSVPSQNVVLNNAATRPENPIKENYKFINWFTTAECTPGTEYDFSSFVTQNITLYAKWEEESYINFVNLDTLSSLNLSYTSTTEMIADTEVYTKVTTPLSGDLSGIYLIEYGKKILSGDTTKLSDKGNYMTLSDKAYSGNEITIDSSYNICKIEVKQNPNNQSEYSFKIGENYIYHKGTSNTLDVSATEVFNIINLQTGQIENTNDKNTTYYLKFNESFGAFRFYKSGQKDINLYKFDRVGTTIENKTFNFSNIDIRFGVKVLASEYDKMKAENGIFGVSILKNGKDEIETKFDCTPELITVLDENQQEVQYYQFAVVLKNVPVDAYGLKVQAKCFVRFGDAESDYHYTKTIKYSVKDVANNYLTASPEQKELYKQHLDALTDLTNK